MENSIPILYYFDLYGRGEAIRLAFYYAKETFEDRRITREEFAKMKSEGAFQFGQVPLLEYKGKRMVQSISILRFLCQQWGYYPNDPESIFQAESIVDFNEDIRAAWRKGRKLPPGEEKDSKLKFFFEEQLPNFMKILEKYYIKMSSNSGYFIGKIMTIADFLLIDLYASIMMHPDRKVYGEKALENCPNLKGFFETRVKDFEDYLAKRPFRSH